MNKFATQFNGLIWTLAGTALVLITLSGSTKKAGLIITGVALVLNLIGMVLERDE
jgi:hypothetical protein